MARSGLCISGWSPAAYLANVCGSASGAGDSVHTPRHGDCKPAADFELRKAGTARLGASTAQLRKARSRCVTNLV